MDMPPIDQPWATAEAPLGITSQPAPGAMPSAPPDMSMGAPVAGMEGLTPDAQPDFDMGHPNNIEAVAAGVHHNRLARMLNSVGSILGGNLSYKLIQNPDGTVDVHPQQSTGAEKVARIAQAALQGMAHGWAAGQGPGGPARALAAGVDAGTQLAAGRQKEARELSKEYTQENRQKMLFDANMKMMQLETAKRIYDRDRAKLLDNRSDETYSNGIEETARNQHADVNVYENVDEFSHAMTDPNNPLFQAYKEHRVRIYHDPSPDAPHRGKVVIIPADRMKDLYMQDYTPRQKHFDPLHPEKEAYYTDGPKIMGGHKTNEEMNAVFQQQEDANTKVDSDHAKARAEQQKQKLEEDKARAQIAADRAQAGAAGAAAELTRTKAEAIKATMGPTTNPNLTPPDPRYPGRDYYPAGEPGVMPYDDPKARTYKLDRDILNKENLANNLVHNVDELNNFFGVDGQGNVTKRRDLIGHLNAIKDKTETEITGISKENSDLGTFVRMVENITQASVGVHGRNAARVNKTVKETINDFLNSPEAVIKMANQDAYSAGNFIDTAQQKRATGNLIPEARRNKVVDDWWAARGARVVDRGGVNREATIEFTTPDKNGNRLRVPYSTAARMVAELNLRSAVATGAMQ